MAAQTIKNNEKLQKSNIKEGTIDQPPAYA